MKNWAIFKTQFDGCGHEFGGWDGLGGLGGFDGFGRLSECSGFGGFVF